MAVPEFIVSSILEQCESDTQFEDFCVKHVSNLRGLKFVPTSRNYDNARDGRTEYPSLVDGQAYICSSLDDNFEVKAGRDLTALLKKDAKPAEVRFCFRGNVTEPVRDAIIAMAKKTGPRNCRIEVTGRVQLIASIKDDMRAFEMEFASDLALFLPWAHQAPAAQSETLALRIGLATQIEAPAAQLRRELLEGFVLEWVAQSSTQSLKEVSEAVRHSLNLESPIAPTYVAECVQSLLDRRLLTREDVRFRVTQPGRDEIDRRRQCAFEHLLDHRSGLRQELTIIAGGKLTMRAFDKIWETLTDALAHSFHHHGMDVVEEVRRIADPQLGTQTAQSTLGESIYAAAHKIYTLSKTIAKAPNIASALPGLFRDPATACFRWASHLCVIYVSCCSLCLDAEVQRAVAERLRNWRVLLDTNVLLSLLGPGEPDHESLCLLVRGWSALGGELVAALPVLEEVRHHAELATEEFPNWNTEVEWFRKIISKGQVQAEFPEPRNVFLRSFLHACGGSTFDSSHWSNFIAQFITAGDSSVQQIAANLKAEFSIPALPDRSGGEELAKTFTQEILLEYGKRRASRPDEHFFEMRATWDGRLLSLLHAEREANKLSGKIITALSSSSALRVVAVRNQAKFGLQTPVMKPSRLSFALALLPGSNLTVNSLRRLMFSDAFQRNVAASFESAKGLAESRSYRKSAIYRTVRLRELVEAKIAENFSEENGSVVLEDPSQPVRAAKPFIGQGCKPAAQKRQHSKLYGLPSSRGNKSGSVA